MNIELIDAYDFEDVEYVEIEHGVANYIGDIPRDKEKLLSLLYFKFNEIVEKLNEIEDRLYEVEVRQEDKLYEIEEKMGLLLSDEKKSKIQERIRGIEKKSRSVEGDLRDVKNEVEDIKPKIENAKKAMYKFIKGCCI